MQRGLTLEMIRTVHIVKREIDGRISNGVSKTLTVPQAHAISFIYDYSKENNVFQKDIEDAFELHRSSVSLMLSNMEKSELIERVPVEEDGRLRKIVLTEKALIYKKEFSKEIEKANKQILENITEEEKKTVMEVLYKMQQNLK